MLPSYCLPSQLIHLHFFLVLFEHEVMYVVNRESVNIKKEDEKVA